MSGIMLTPEHKDELRKKFRWIFVSYLFSLLPAVCCLIICRMMEEVLGELTARGEYPIEFGVSVKTVQISIIAAAIVLMLLIGILRERLLKVRAVTNRKKRFDPMPLPLVEMAAAKYRFVLTLSGILADIILFMGIVLFYLTGGLEHVYLYFLIWGLLLFLLRPRFMELEQLAIDSFHAG